MPCQHVYAQRHSRRAYPRLFPRRQVELPQALSEETAPSLHPPIRQRVVQARLAKAFFSLEILCARGGKA
eukprot:scaffold121752_cov29-Tisochrysis_lutea.AAC.13